MSDGTTPLYQLAEMRDVLDSWLYEEHGVETPELGALLKDLDGEVDRKIEACGLYIRELDSEAERIGDEEKRLRDRRKARENAANSLRAYLLRQMERLSKDRVKGTLLTVALQASPPAVTSTLTDDQMHDLWCDDETFIKPIPVSYRIDRTAVLNAVKAGQEIPEGIAVTQSRHVRLR